MKTPVKSTSANKSVSKKHPSTHEEIRTDYPLSEKDEVKRAERNLRESQKKHG
jgi:hypothetical protein